PGRRSASSCTITPLRLFMLTRMQQRVGFIETCASRITAMADDKPLEPDEAEQSAPSQSAGPKRPLWSPGRLLALRVFLRERLRSPGFWLVLLAFLLGLLGAWYLWLPREPSFTSGRDEFKPELVVIQLNDTYRVDAVGDGKLGGLGRVVTLVRQIRE